MGETNLLCSVDVSGNSYCQPFALDRLGSLEAGMETASDFRTTAAETTARQQSESSILGQATPFAREWGLAPMKYSLPNLMVVAIVVVWC